MWAVECYDLLEEKARRSTLDVAVLHCKYRYSPQQRRCGSVKWLFICSGYVSIVDAIAAELLKNSGPNLVDALHAVIQQACR
jgi:hypothetical protein